MHYPAAGGRHLVHYQHNSARLRAEQPGDGQTDNSKTFLKRSLANGGILIVKLAAIVNNGFKHTRALLITYFLFDTSNSRHTRPQKRRALIAKHLRRYPNIGRRKRCTRMTANGTHLQIALDVLRTMKHSL